MLVAAWTARVAVCAIGVAACATGPVVEATGAVVEASACVTGVAAFVTPSRSPAAEADSQAPSTSTLAHAKAQPSRVLAIRADPLGQGCCALRSMSLKSPGLRRFTHSSANLCQPDG